MSLLGFFSGKQSWEDRETERLLADVRSLRTKSAIKSKDDAIDFSILIMEQVGAAFDATLGMRIGTPVYALIRTLLDSEPFVSPLPEGNLSGTLAEGVALRNTLRQAKRMHADERYYIAKWQEAISAILSVIYDELPEQAFVDPDIDGNFEEYSRLAPTAPLYTYIKNVPVLIHKILATIFAQDLQNDVLFSELRERLYINAAIASGIPIEERFSTSRQAVLPEDQRGLDDGELINLYMKNTPFINLFTTDIPLHIPDVNVRRYGAISCSA